MDQIHPSVDGFISSKEDLARIERIREKADPCAVPPPLPSSPSPTAPKPLSVAEPGSSSGSASKLLVASSFHPAAPKPLSVAELGSSSRSPSQLQVVSWTPPVALKPSSAAAPSLKRKSKFACVPTDLSLKRPSPFVSRPPILSSAAELSLNPPPPTAFWLRQNSDWTITSSCCTSFVAGNFRLAAPIPLSFAPTPSRGAAFSSSAALAGSSSAATTSPSTILIDPFTSSASNNCNQKFTDRLDGPHAQVIEDDEVRIISREDYIAMRKFRFYVDGPPRGVYQDALPIVPRKSKLPCRKVEALSRASAVRSAASRVRPTGRPIRVGHHAIKARPKRFCVQLDENDLYMLIIPKALRCYVKGRPYPRLLEIVCGKDCGWVVHAQPYKGEVVLSKGWPACAAFHELKVGDYLVFKANADGFKITIYDRTTSCQKVFICEEHARLV